MSEETNMVLFMDAHKLHDDVLGLQGELSRIKDFQKQKLAELC